MTLQTDKQIADKVIDSLFRYLVTSFICEDQTGKTVGQVVNRYAPAKAETIISKIALTVLGANLPGQRSQIRNLKFVN